ncbi:MAG: di-heme oxidoredictase family protein [Microthrixaceae bacterium]
MFGISPTALAVAAGAATVLWLVLMGGCGSDGSVAPSGVVDADLGGSTTRAEVSRNAFGLSAPGLTNEQRRRFERGDSFFTQNWVTAPASTDARDGLGPTFNAQACSSCHVRDGRGAPPDPGGDEARLGLLYRVSVPGADPGTGGPLADPVYGDQLQDAAVLGVPAEGAMELSYETVEGAYGDGTSYRLREPTYSVGEPAFGPVDHLLIGPRLAPVVFGVGLLEAIPAEDIEAAADPDDADGDGISGRVNRVFEPRSGGSALGRFGWKSNVATVEAQTAGAFHGDIGITSLLAPRQNCPQQQRACAAAPAGGQPELTDDRLESVTFYTRTLAVPAMRNLEDPAVQRGAELFGEFGCSSCHAPTQVTGDSDVDALADEEFHPYTDLLLHDMGDGLADGRPDFGASGSEWRTPPLWGIGLIEAVNGHRFLLHDGRARDIPEAILWHGGEAEDSKERFRNAPRDRRDDLVAFLESL